MFLAVPAMMCAMTPSHDAAARQRLATLVTQRRLELGMDKIEVARAAGITITTYGKIEAGESVRDTSYGKVEPVLDWAPGSALDVLAGATHATLITNRVGPASTSPIVTADITSAVQEAAIHVSDGITAPEIRKLAIRVVELLRERGKLPQDDQS